MQNITYIPNRLINLVGVMPVLGNDFTITFMSVTISIGMIPIPTVDKDFDFLVVGFKLLPEGHTVLPLGIVPKHAHPMFFTQIRYVDMDKPTVWYGKAKFRDYKMAMESLEQLDFSSTSMRKFRNLNLVAEEIYKKRLCRSYGHYVKYSGTTSMVHELPVELVQSKPCG